MKERQKERLGKQMRERLRNKRRIVIKIGSSSLTHEITGNLNMQKLEKLVRAICDLRNQGMEVVLVSSGAIAVGRKALGLIERPKSISMRQACAAIGQANLMMIYQKLFSEYHQLSAQVLMTKNTMMNALSRHNAKNTFDELLKLGVVPVVNENDTVATYEIEFGDNDKLSAIVAALIGADLLILLSDIDGLFTDDPNKNPQAEFIDIVPEITPELAAMGKDAQSNVGTGGMASKIAAARIATDSGADMVIANARNTDIIYDILRGEKAGTLFLAHKNIDFDLLDYLSD